MLFDTHPAVTYAISRSLNEMGYTIALNLVDGLARQSLEHCVETLAARFGLDPTCCASAPPNATAISRRSASRLFPARPRSAPGLWRAAA